MFKPNPTIVSALVVCCIGSAISAPNATGFFKSNGSVQLTLKPITVLSGTVVDTTFTYSLKAGDSIAFSLPVDGKTVGIVDLQKTASFEPKVFLTNGTLSVDAGSAMSNGTISLFTLNGREVSSFKANKDGQIRVDIIDLSRGIYILSGKSELSSFAVKLNFDGSANAITSANISGLNKTRAAAETNVTYRLDAKSSDSYFGDLTNQSVILVSGSNGTKNIVLPTAVSDVVTNFKSLLDSATYHKLFPNRYGFGREEDEWNPGKITSSDGLFDFYSYRSLIAAIIAISDVKIERWNREGDVSNYASKIKWFNTRTGKQMEFLTHDDYNESWNIDKKEIKTAEVSFSKFCMEGDLFTRKRELSAFLANISHETTGMGSTEPKKNWGLYWREEVNWQKGSKELGYIDPNSKTYPPYTGKSYHGRGPIQISYNTNYGQVSEFLFGDKNILLKNPELVLTTDSDGDKVEDAMLAYQTAIWFWMYPQGLKPSCHDVMVGNWKPTAIDIQKGRDKSRFGMTINVINGGQECNKGDGLDSPLDRIGFYKKYSEFMKVPVPADEYCDCGKMEYMH